MTNSQESLWMETTQVSENQDVGIIGAILKATAVIYTELAKEVFSHLA